MNIDSKKPVDPRGILHVVESLTENSPNGFEEADAEVTELELILSSLEESNDELAKINGENTELADKLNKLD